MGRSLGKGMREFKDSVTGNDRDEAQAPAALPTANETTAVPAPSRENETTV
jgi:Sec-independent protein translocase protein TatA